MGQMANPTTEVFVGACDHLMRNKYPASSQLIKFDHPNERSLQTHQKSRKYLDLDEL